MEQMIEGRQYTQDLKKIRAIGDTWIEKIYPERCGAALHPESLRENGHDVIGSVLWLTPDP